LSYPDEPYDKPAWIGEDVTSDPRYYNSYLAANPVSGWK
jgi:adenylate cyclase